MIGKVCFSCVNLKYIFFEMGSNKGYIFSANQVSFLFVSHQSRQILVSSCIASIFANLLLLFQRHENYFISKAEKVSFYNQRFFHIEIVPNFQLETYYYWLIDLRFVRPLTTFNENSKVF